MFDKFNNSFITDIIDKISNEPIVNSTPSNLIKVDSIDSTIQLTPEQSGTTFMVSPGTYTISLPNNTAHTITPGLFYRFVLIDGQESGNTITIFQDDENLNGTLLQSGQNSNTSSYYTLNGNNRIYFREIAKHGDYYEIHSLSADFWLVKGFSSYYGGLFIII
jgi:hypothetical protein